MLFKEINWNGLRSVNERAGEGLRFWTPGSRYRSLESLRRKSFAGRADGRVLRAADTGQDPSLSPKPNLRSQLRLLDVRASGRAPTNPATGETIKIPAKKVVKFRVAKAAKDSIVPPKKAK